MSTPSEPMADQLETEFSGKRSARPVLLIGAAGVAALTIGGGAFAVNAMMGGGGDQPSTAMPSSVAAYMQIDIDPSVGQKVAALQFFQGMDTTELEEMRDGKGREALFDWIAEDDPEGPLADMNYEEDVEPWLGDRAGIGVMPGDTTDDLVPVVAVQVKDEAAAESFLNEVMADGGDEEVEFFFRGDYVVFAEPDEAEDVKIAMDQGTLADAPAFSADLEALGEQGIVSMWADLPAFQDLSNSVNEELNATLGETAADTPLLDGQTQLEGRMAATLRFDEDAIEFYGAAFDAGANPIEGGDSAHLISSLPADTSLAFAFENGDQYVDQIWSILEEAYPEDTAAAQEEAAAEGFNLPDDLKTMLGNSAVLAAGPDITDVEAMDNGEIPSIGYAANTDAEAAVALVDRLIEFSGEGMSAEEMGISYGADGDLFVIASDPAYQQALAGNGDLGSTRDFTLAVPDADDADVAAFVSLNDLEPLYLDEMVEGQERDMVASMAAVGMASTSDGEGGGTFSVRLVFDE
ncbi:MAG: DUF3352 domain-containing protein [Ornithinimicrobium sp.]